VWRDVMDYAMQGERVDANPPPAGLVHVAARFDQLEPDRDEWFVEGTQIEHVVPVGSVAGRAHLESPANGAIFAIDPDIPASRQRIVLRARGAGSDERFVLPDGSIVAASEPYLWEPTRGHYAMALVAADGRVLDRAKIEVR